MNVKFRRYSHTPGFTEDFNLVRNFLVRINANEITPHDFPWGRWEWAFSLPYLDEQSISRIGIWEDSGKIVGLATYEDKLGSAYFSLDKEYAILKQEMLSYAATELSVDGKFRALIPDIDVEFQLVASKNGFRPSESREYNSVYDIELDSINYDLPDGYTVSNLASGYDIRKYGRVL